MMARKLKDKIKSILYFLHKPGADGGKQVTTPDGSPGCVEVTTTDEGEEQTVTTPDGPAGFVEVTTSSNTPEPFFPGAQPGPPDETNKMYPYSNALGIGKGVYVAGVKVLVSRVEKQAAKQQQKQQPAPVLLNSEGMLGAPPVNPPSSRPGQK